MSLNPKPVLALGDPLGTASLRVSPQDFFVEESLGFEPEGEGEHAFLRIEKTGIGTQELAQQVATQANVPRRDVGYSGLKDSRAVTRQWLSVGLAGKPAPDWRSLEADGRVAILEVKQHRKKLRRGVHRANCFVLVLRDLRTPDKSLLEQRLQQVAQGGVPNYFGVQRFGHNGSTLAQARHWLDRGGRRIARNRKSLYLSALRSALFNALLAERVEAGTWCEVAEGDACMLNGTHSVFAFDGEDPSVAERCRQGDVHPALPLWGRGEPLGSALRHQAYYDCFGEWQGVADGLCNQGLSLAYRPARVLPDDFCWEFCDDDVLRLEFSLGAGSYATAVVAELVEINDGDVGSGASIE